MSRKSTPFVVRLTRTGVYRIGAMKFGKIKRMHSRVGGLDALLERILAECPGVTRIVPGRIKVRRGKNSIDFKVQYPTPTGLKCQFNGTGTVQEVFIVTNQPEQAALWIEKELR